MEMLFGALVVVGLMMMLGGPLVLWPKAIREDNWERLTLGYGICVGGWVVVQLSAIALKSITG